MLWTYLVIVNVGTFFLMGFDKLSSKVSSERIPELWFILTSLIGGFVGVVLGMFAFHHKVSKTSFQLKIGAAATLAVLALLLLMSGR